MLYFILLRHLVIGILLICASSVYGQLESARWYFGHYAGIDFSSGEAVAVYDGQLSTGEGCASIADSEGNLLFYTDGSTVWNANHEIMQNGTGLLGDASSTQSAIIVPKPGDLQRYYIFTVGAFDGIFIDDVPEGMHYYIVNMSLDNGLGAVESYDNENNFLPGFPREDRSSEKIAAVRHPNRQHYWLMTHFEDSFYSWLINGEGIQSPVISTIGPYLSTYGYPVNARGYLKISPDGNRVGIAHLSYLHDLDSTAYHANNVQANIAPGILAVYQFNPYTGAVSNEQILNYNAENEYYGTPYGLEFSPNSQLLYAGLDYHNPPSSMWRGAQLIQYNLSTAQFQQTILADSIDFVPNNGSSILRARGGMQLALDGKIYYSVTRSRTGVPTSSSQYGGIALSVINNPNMPGLAADYQHESFLIHTPENDSTWISYGLPPFVSSFLTTEIVFNEDDLVNEACVDELVQFSVSSDTTVASVNWNFGDGNSSTIVSPEHAYTQEGIYTITAAVTDTEGFTIEALRQITIHPLPEVQNASLQQCDPDADGVALFTLSDANEQLLASGNVEDHAFEYFLNFEDAESGENALPIDYYSTSHEQLLHVRITNEFGCVRYAELSLHTVETYFQNVQPLAICDDDFDGIAFFNLALQYPILQAVSGINSEEITFHLNLQDAGNGLNALPINYQNQTPHAQTIYARIENQGSCAAIFSFDLLVHPLPTPELENVVICPSNDSYTFELPGYVEYLWSGMIGDDLNQPLNTSSITITQAGQYSVQVTNQFGCVNSTDFQVTFAEIPVITQVQISNGNSASVFTNMAGQFEYSLDGITWQTSNNFSPLQPGVYRVWTRLGEGCESLFYEFGVLDIPNVITPNNDGLNDTWAVPGIAAYPGSLVRIFDRYGKELHQMLVPETGIIEEPIGRSVFSQNRLVLWDGYYLGRRVPSTSYWYIIRLTDGRQYSGWITVKNFYKR
ncbi:MAG: T9SS type B sorting domain-containing protein [Weeksellaceae bacterium]|nr:T9SS type B sorting domain-containing protein [Weeksellaceae bacterium]